ncbi:expansin A13 [Tanacetum coccineum]
MTSSLTVLTIILSLNSILLTSAHYFPPPSPEFVSEWKSARATYYAAADPRDAVGGACGYGDLEKAGWCIPGTSIIVTATNFCAPNYGFPSEGGGKCNPPNEHFVLPIEIFEKIAIWKASNMPIHYRRYGLCHRGGAVGKVVSCHL